MSRASKYGILDLRGDFPTSKACLEYIFDMSHSRRCGCGGVFSLRRSRKSFRCGRCKKEIAPLARTIFGKSKTPLALWFHALMVFSNAKSSISAQELERNLGVTYKCAWRMLREIRRALVQGTAALSGIVETDGAYLGGKKKGFKWRSEAILSKPVVMAAIERHGRVKAEIVSGTGGSATKRFIVKSVMPGSRLMTDGAGSYKRLGHIYNIESVIHSKKEYARGDVHVNSVESFWSHVKRSIKGTHKSVSKEHMQSYLDAFAFHHNNADKDRERFFCLLSLAVRGGGA